MWRKTIIALAAVCTIGATMISTDASARPRGGHGWGGHGWGGHFRGRGWGYGGLGLGLGLGLGYGGYYAYNDGCWQPRLVPTRWGMRYRRVWVCY